MPLDAHQRVSTTSYRLLENWSTGTPTGEVFGRVSGVAFDHKEFVLVYRRDGGNIWTFDQGGRFRQAWGSNGAKRTHGIRVDPRGFVWTTDDQGHQVKKWSADGKVLLTLGVYDGPGDGPNTFNGPTDVAVAPNGDFFVADGYGNYRIAEFTATGKFIKAWGSKGSAPGEFNLPHAIIIDSRGRVLVADRENQRIQIFDQEGRFLEQWRNLGEPVALDIRDDVLYVADGDNPKVLLASLKDGKVIAMINTADENQHALAVDGAGKVYVGSVRGQYLKVYGP